MSICPAKRPTATLALNSEYFKTDPPPSVPGTREFYSVNNSFLKIPDSHELDSRKSKMMRFNSGTKQKLPDHFDVEASSSRRDDRFEPRRKYHS